MLPLTLHSHYSLLRGTASCQTLCRRVRKLGYTVAGLTDHNNLHGLWPFLESCREHGLRPVIGADIVARQRVFALVKDKEGYSRLCRLLTRIEQHRELDLSTLDPRELQGLILLVLDPFLLRHWREQELQVAAGLIDRPTQEGGRLRRIARSLAVPAVALADVFFAAPGEYHLHRLLRAIARRTTLSRLCPHDCCAETGWLAPPQEYARRFAVWPETVRASHELAEQCSFTGPDFGLVLPPWPGADPEQTLRRLALRGAGRLYGYPLPAPVTSRLRHELEIIGRMGFARYFLVVREIVRPAARTCGRGSGAASLVAYCLGITNVCPLRHDLYFERFLNPGRRDAPDLDIDFPWDERGAILRGVFDRFGVHAAMVCNLVTLRPRMAVRETARVYGLDEASISRVTRGMSGFRFRDMEPGNLAAGIRALDRMRRVPLDPPWPLILAEAGAISGCPRHVSAHPGGVIITPQPVCHYVPVSNRGRFPLIHWDKESTEQAGLVKIDLLGNRSLAVIRDALAMVREHTPLPREHDWRPDRDARTRHLIRRGQTMGCFYIESPAMRLLQQKADRGDFDQLVILSSIIRPAAGRCIHEYLRRLHGGCRPPSHPALKGVLDDTLGIMVFQEDVSRVAVRLGFSASEADRLRRIMSKKDRSRSLARYRERFLAAARKQGISRQEGEQLWSMMMSFDGYSFCKPHSASYARVSFQAAWLKAHYPAEFMAAVLDNQGGYYSTFAYVSEARRLGIVILPPAVNRAGVSWHGCRGRLRVGLRAVRGLSAATAERIVRQRDKRPYTSLHDFLTRVVPAADEARALIHAGCCDDLEQSSSRGVLFYRLAAWQRGRKRKTALFPLGSSLPPLPPDDPEERLRNEYRVLGFLCRIHPVLLFDGRRRQYRTQSAREILRSGPGRKVSFLGWCISGKTVATRTGQVMEFVSFEDETGMVECTFFPAVWRRSCHLLEPGRPLLLEGVVEEDFRARTLRVMAAIPVRPDRKSSGAVCPGPSKAV